MLCRSRSIRALCLFRAEEGVAEEEGVTEGKGADSCKRDAIIRISGGVLVLRTVEF